MDETRLGKKPFLQIVAYLPHIRKLALKLSFFRNSLSSISPTTFLVHFFHFFRSQKRLQKWLQNVTQKRLQNRHQKWFKKSHFSEHKSALESTSKSTQIRHQKVVQKMVQKVIQKWSNMWLEKCLKNWQKKVFQKVDESRTNTKKQRIFARFKDNVLSKRHDWAFRATRPVVALGDQRCPWKEQKCVVSSRWCASQDRVAFCVPKSASRNFQKVIQKRDPLTAY